jgi:hypothetical protein
MSPRYVQACITAVSFPDTLDELRNRITINRRIPGALTDIDSLERFRRSDDTWWTAPRWITKGDILFFYHTASARANVASLRRQLQTSRHARTVHHRAVERGADQIEAYSRTIFACAEVAGRSTWGGRPSATRHFQSTIFAPLGRVHVFDSPLPISEFSRVVTLSTGGTLTAVHGRALTALKRLLRRRNTLPAFLRDARPGATGFRGVSARNWPKVAASTAAFIDESQLRAYLIDYLLEEVKDRGTRVYEECRCCIRGESTGRADYFVRIHGEWIPVEAKLNITAEQDLPKQMRKYLRIDGFFPGRRWAGGAPVPVAPCGLALIVESDGVYLLAKGRLVSSGVGKPTWPRGALSHRTGALLRGRIAEVLHAG